ncbi:hypothetical protein PQZ47_00465 [Candidatus Pelagibacter sp.]|nr:hypothetical protein [Candidatus Pelagibacter sp.]
MKNNKKINIVNEIQKVRARNNKNWMNILKVAIKFAPKETQKIMKKINSDDKKISNLVSKLTSIN